MIKLAEIRMRVQGMILMRGHAEDRRENVSTPVDVLADEPLHGPLIVLVPLGMIDGDRGHR
jgi:hypothetical protein